MCIRTDNLIFGEDSCLQKHKKQPIHLPVPATAADSLHHLMMVDMIEAALYITFDNPRTGEAAPFAVDLFP